MIFRMFDKYASFAELARAEEVNRDYRVRAIERPESAVAVIAPHGGAIERGTSELAEWVAGDEYSFFAFEGLKPWGQNRDLHITSHRFDHPVCLALIERCAVVLSIHGCAGESQIYVGGLDAPFASLLGAALGRAGFPVTQTGHPYAGRHPLNVCNRGARGRGAQVELTMDLRGDGVSRCIAAVAQDAIAQHLRTIAS
jgi:phage replication-related protein YjqB (UPF0714/DUF867 family)